MTLDKSHLRQKFSKIRASLSHERKESGTNALIDELSPQLSKCSLVLSYSSIRSEVSTSKVNRMLIDQNKLVLPKVTEWGLKIYKVSSMDECCLGKYKILEPTSLCPEVNIHEISIVLAPGLAFDEKGVRLGYGKGYYDALLKDFKGLKLGIAFSEQKSRELLPQDPWDIPMDEVLWI